MGKKVGDTTQDRSAQDNDNDSTQGQDQDQCRTHSTHIAAMIDTDIDTGTDY